MRICWPRRECITGFIMECLSWHRIAYYEETAEKLPFPINKFIADTKGYELFLLVTNGATAILNYSVRKLTGSTIESGCGWVYNINIRYRYLILSVDIKNAETVRKDA